MLWTTGVSPPSPARANHKVTEGSSAAVTYCSRFRLWFLTDQCFPPVNGELDVTAEDEDDEEELFELSSNRATSDVCIEAEGGDDEDESETCDSKEEENGASTADLHRAVIEDIRLLPFNTDV